MIADDFKAWLQSAAPGASITWHTGFLARERKAWTDRDGVKHDPIAGLDRLARAVAGAADSGAVTLTQQRIDEARWEYIAVRAVPPVVRMRGYSVGRRIVLAA